MHRFGGVIWASRVRRIREPDFVVLLNIQVAFQGIRKWGVFMVEIPKVGAVDRRTRKDAGRDGREKMAGVG